MKHSKTIPGYNGDLQQLAEEVGDLHYSALEEFIVQLSNKLMLDSFADRKLNRPKLADSLGRASSQLLNAATFVGNANKISEPYQNI